MAIVIFLSHIKLDIPDIYVSKPSTKIGRTPAGPEKWKRNTALDRRINARLNRATGNIQ